jgi:hypothetical protein
MFWMCCTLCIPCEAGRITYPGSERLEAAVPRPVATIKHKLPRRIQWSAGRRGGVHGRVHRRRFPDGDASRKKGVCLESRTVRNLRRTHGGASFQKPKPLEEKGAGTDEKFRLLGAEFTCMRLSGCRCYETPRATIALGLASNTVNIRPPFDSVMASQDLESIVTRL